MSEKRTILVIEDEHAISNFICRALNANDYKAIPAASGKEGLSLFFSHSPDLVLLDLGLPDMDGLEVLGQLSGLPRETPWQAVILLIGDGDGIEYDLPHHSQGLSIQKLADFVTRDSAKLLPYPVQAVG